MPTMLFLGPTFTLNIPTDWAVLSGEGVQVLFLSPPTEDQQQVNLAVLMQPVETGVTLTSYMQNVKAAQAANYPAYQVMLEGDFQTEAGLNGLELRVTWRKPTSAEGIYQQQVFLSDASLIYVLTYTRSVGLAESLIAPLDALAEDILKSFRLGAVTLNEAYFAAR